VHLYFQSVFSLRSLVDEEEEENAVVKREFSDYNQVELLCHVALEINENSHKLVNPISGEAMKIKVGIFFFFDLMV
jgi:hypothetical protein